MRPALKSGLLPVWRDRDTLQIGIDPRRAIALTGMSQAAFVIGLLDGSRERDQVMTAAAERGIPVQATERILTLLAAGGALDDFPASTFRAVPPALRVRLAPELATSSLAHGDGDGGARALARRRTALVRIEGDQRIGRAAARILGTAGIGSVEFVRPRPDELVRPRQALAQRPRSQRRAVPSWPEAPGQRHTMRVASTRAAHAAHPSVQHKKPDLVILAGRQSLARLTELARDRVPHLSVIAGEAIGVVGPLVVPRRTTCLLCLDYIRAGNDPAWPLILAQLGRRRPDPPACDAVLAAAVAAQAAAQALIAIEQSPYASAAVNGTLEIVLPDWRWRRRTWEPHPACPCATHTVR
jgi:hypothetical protein